MIWFTLREHRAQLVAMAINQIWGHSAIWDPGVAHVPTTWFSAETMSSS